MTIPARYLLRMSAFLAVVCAGLIVVGDRLVAAFAANVFLNGLIVFVLLVGIVFKLGWSMYKAAKKAPAPQTAES